jgi:hypothetical protein
VSRLACAAQVKPVCLLPVKDSRNEERSNNGTGFRLLIGDDDIDLQDAVLPLLGQRKTELVLRLLRGELPDAVSRDSQIPADTANRLRDWIASPGCVRSCGLSGVTRGCPQPAVTEPSMHRR